MKLLIRISERIEIVHITIVFVSVLVGFIIDIAALSWLKLPHLNSPNSYMGTYPGVGICPGHYSNMIT